MPFKCFLVCFLNLIFLPLYFGVFFICIILSFIPIFPTRTAKNNLKDRLQANNLHQHYVLSLIYLNYFFYFMEVFVFDFFGIIYWNSSQLSRTGIDTKDMLSFLCGLKQRYGKAEGRGLLFLLGHMANVEMCTAPVLPFYPQAGFGELYALAKPSRFAFANTLMERYRFRKGLQIIWTDKKNIIKMFRVMKNGGSLCLLVDQKPSSKGVFLDFFGKYAEFPTSGLSQAMENNMIIVHAAAKRIVPGWMRFVLREGNNNHLLDLESQGQLPKEYFAPIYPIKKNLKLKEPLLKELAFFVHWYEGEIRKNVAQWCWDYRKWSRTPTET